MTSQREILRRVPFLSTLGDDCLDIVGRAVRPLSLPSGTMLFRRGEPGESMVILARGRLAVLVPGADGVETEVAAIYPGEVVGEMACVDPAPRSATVQATRASTALQIDRTLLRAMQSKVPAAAVAITGGVIKHLTHRIRETNERIDKELTARGMSGVGGPKDAPLLPQKGEEAPGRIDLKKIPCLKDFSREQLKAFLSVAPPRTFAGGTTLCREGDPGCSCFIVAQGAVDVVRQMAGRERILAVLDTGSMVGQMALVDKAPRSATVRTRGTCVVLELERRAFEKLLAARSQVAIRFQEQIAIAGIRQLRMANQRLETLLQMGAVAPRQTGDSLGAFVPTYARGGKVSRVASRLRPPAPTNAPPRRNARPAAPSPAAPNPLDRVQQARSEDEEMSMMFAYMQTALGEWDMSLAELDGVQVTKPAGLVSATEERARGGG